MWVLGGSITSSNSCVNIAAAKRRRPATSRCRHWRGHDEPRSATRRRCRARPNECCVFHAKLALAGDDILRLLGGVGVPVELPSGLDLVHDRRRLSRTVSAAGANTRPTHRRVTLATDLMRSSLSDWTTGLLTAFWSIRHHRFFLRRNGTTCSSVRHRTSMPHRDLGRVSFGGRFNVRRLRTYATAIVFGPSPARSHPNRPAVAQAAPSSAQPTGNRMKRREFIAGGCRGMVFVGARTIGIEALPHRGAGYEFAAAQRQFRCIPAGSARTWICRGPERDLRIPFGGRPQQLCRAGWRIWCLDVDVIVTQHAGRSPPRRQPPRFRW